MLCGRTGLANDQRRTTNHRFSDPKETSITRADIPAFLVVGIKTRTSNAKEATAEGAIPRQWERFFQHGILGQIPNRVGSNIYAVYSDYASDHNGEYSYIIGAMVKDGTAPPTGMAVKRVPAGQYGVLTSEKGRLPKVVPEVWRKLWKLEDSGMLKRAYQTDFEIYDQRAQDPQNGQVDIYVGLK